MIDTLMVMWNRGHGGRSILVSLAFFLICISISLLLVSLGGPFFSQLKLDPRGNHKSIVSAAKLTPTPQSTGAEPAADNTVTISAPTATATTTICNTPVVTRTPFRRGNSTIYRGGNHRRPHPKPTHPRPTPTPQPTTTPRPTPTPGMTPTLTPVPTATSMPTPTPTVVPTRTPIPTATATPTPTVVPTVTLTPIATLEVTATFPARTGAIVNAKNFSRLGGGGNPVPIGTTSSGQSGNIWNTDCLHAGYSLDLNPDGLIMTAVERNLWLIFGGSTLGTLLFYVVAYLLVRNRAR